MRTELRAQAVLQRAGDDVALLGSPARDQSSTGAAVPELSNLQFKSALRGLRRNMRCIKYHSDCLQVPQF